MHARNCITILVHIFRTNKFLCHHNSMHRGCGGWGCESEHFVPWTFVNFTLLLDFLQRGCQINLPSIQWYSLGGKLHIWKLHRVHDFAWGKLSNNYIFIYWQHPEKPCAVGRGHGVLKAEPSVPPIAGTIHNKSSPIATCQHERYYSILMKTKYSMKMLL